MAQPRPPPAWLIHPVVVAAMLAAALVTAPHTDAPAPPPPPPAAEGAALAQATPFDPLSLQRARRPFGGQRVTAFAVGDDGGAWITTAELARRCPHPALLVGGGEGALASARAVGAGELAVLATRGGAAALPLSPAPPAYDTLAYVAGFPGGRPGEAAIRLLGPVSAPVAGGARPSVPVLAWAVIGHTEGVSADPSGFVGAPALDGEGRVVGVVVGGQPRRGRLYTAPLAEIAAALRTAGAHAAPAATGQAITRADYGLAADDLRRAWRVVPAVCAAG